MTETIAAPAVSVQETVQMRQYEKLGVETAQATRNAGRTPDPVHWIYARVMALEGNSALRLQVTHLGNRQFGEIVIARPGEYRTQSDVEALLAAAKEAAAKSSTAQTRLQVRRFANQLKRFAKFNAAIAAGEKSAA